MSIFLLQIYFKVFFLDELLKPIFSNYFFDSNPDTISSYLISLYETEAIVCSIMCDEIIIRKKNYVLLIRIGYLVKAVCSIAIVLSFCYKHVLFIFVTNILISLYFSFVLSALFGAQHPTHSPRATDFVLSCLVCGFIPHLQWSWMSFIDWFWTILMN